MLALSAFVAPSVEAVPDARLTVEEAEVSDDRPEPGEFVNISVTVANSAGSGSAVEVDRLELREGGGGPLDSLDRATSPTRSGLGSLSAGDSVTVPLVVSFEETGRERVDVYVEGDDEDGRTVTASRPVDFFVGGEDVEEATVDVGVDAGLVTETEDEDDEDDDVGGVFGDAVGGDLDDGALGDEEEGDGQEVFEVRVTNFGNVEVRDVLVAPHADGESLPRIAVGRVDPFEEETVTFEPSADEPTTYRFDVGYVAAGDNGELSRSVEYVPERASLTVTDVGMERENGDVTVTGNVGNVGDAEARGTVVSVVGGEGVEPAYPSADNFVGTVPESDFTFFELTADVDEADAEALPVELRYNTGGETVEELVELDVDISQEDTEDEGGSAAPYAVAVLVAVIAAAAVYVRRRR